MIYWNYYLLTLIPNENYQNLLRQLFLLAKELRTDREEFWKYPYSELQIIKKVIEEYHEEEDKRMKEAENKNRVK